MIPPELQLEQRQIDKARRFRDEVILLIVEGMSQEELVDALDDEVTPTSPFTFSLYRTGLGTEITLTCFDKRTSLSIDDDGEIVPDEWRADAPDWCRWKEQD